MAKKESLSNLYPHYFGVPSLILISIGCLAAGLIFPIMSFKELVFLKHTFSVLTGIEALWTEGHKTLSVVVFIFSVVFPILKLTTLLVIWFWRFSDGDRKRLIDWIGQIGKWSMLDVFVVAITVVITKLSALLKAEPLYGIYFFGASVLIAMAVTLRVEQLAKKRL